MKYAANSLDFQWMPFTANRQFKADPRLFVRGEGVYYWNHRGEKIIDGSSGTFIAMPSRQRKDGTYQDVAHPINRETREWLEAKVIGAYK